MPTIVNDISARTDRIDVQTRARPYCGCAMHLIAQQRPMWPLKEFEQTGRRSRCTPNWGIRSAITSSQPRSSDRSFKGQRRLQVTEIQLLSFAAAAHAPGRLELFEEFGR